MMGTLDSTSKMRSPGERIWYRVMYFKMCLRAAPSQVQRMIRCPLFGFLGVKSEVRGPTLMKSIKGGAISKYLIGMA